MLSLVFLLFILSSIDASHFRGGIISWRAHSTVPSGSKASILIRQRYSWRRSYWPLSMCTASTIASQTLIASGTGSVTCFAGSCGSFTSIIADVPCTDFSVGTDFSSGERYDTRNLTINQSYIVGYWSNAWFSLAMGGGGDWQMTAKIDLTVRSDGKINTSPVTSTLPIIYKEVTKQHVHIVQMADADATDTLRCRWSTASGNTNGYNECRSVCAPSLPPGYTLFSDNCTLVFWLNDTDYFAVALQIEDFYTPSSSTPMSSVPIQFLFYGQPAPGGSCSAPPAIIGVRPNLACIGIPIGDFVNETVIAQVGCSGKTIIDFTTSSPTGMSKTNIKNTSPGIYVINLLWTPNSNHYGPQGFCAGAVDNTNVQSIPWCVTFLVGFTAPNLQPPVIVQGSASPVGTIFSNHSVFSIQSKNNVTVNRPQRNGTFVNFTDATTNTTVLSIDCGSSPSVIYSRDTIIIYAPYPWVPGHRYFITFESGATSGTEFCRAESAPITDPNFWVFDIWDPGYSSTTPTTTTPPTPPTVTTRGQSTTTPIANLTTTGIITTSSTLPSITTRAISSSSSTTMTTVTKQTTMTSLHIMTREDFIKACEQPVAVGTALMALAMVPINIAAMFTLFTKIDKIFNPAHLMAQLRSQKR